VESVAVQTLPQSVDWEILVVDNNSSDQTRQVVEDLRQRHPDRIRYLLEPRQGVSHARNAGIQEARGDILAFIDDDETAGSGWLQNLTSSLHNGDWAGAGGRVVPQWRCSRPRWLSSQNSFLSGPLAAFDVGPEGELIEPPFGANMAFRKDIFERYGGFRTDLGRVGKSLLSSEDTEFGRRLIAAGERLRWEPSAITYHPVEEDRVRKEYFQEWWFNKGRSDIRELGIQPKCKRFLGIPLRLLRDTAVEVARWTVSFEASQRFICWLKVWAYAGEAYEAYHQSRDAKRKRREGNGSIGSSRVSE
jgi:glycosyltransferase involved in cell wall biosynthesis